MAVRRCPKKKKKIFLEKAQRYSRDIHSKKLAAECAIFIGSRLREKWGRRLRWRHPVFICLSVVLRLCTSPILACSGDTRQTWRTQAQRGAELRAHAREDMSEKDHA